MADVQTGKIVLAQLYSELQPPNAEPFAIEVLASAIETFCPGWDVDLKTINPSIDSNAVRQFITSIPTGRCKLIGLSVPQGTYPLALDILSTLENCLHPIRRPLVVLGHALPTYMPEVFLKHYPWTVVARGWGEDALIGIVEMLQAGDLRLEELPGITYMRDGRLVSTPLRYAIIPRPPIRLQPGRYFARVETSRGCHYGRCTFCTRPPGRKDYWERLPLDSVLDSVLELKDKEVHYFTFSDEDFIGNDLGGALDIARGLAEIGEMKFSLSVRADNIFNPDALAGENLERLHVMYALRNAGLAMIFIGVESLSDPQLKRYGKGIRTKDSIRAVNIVKSLGIPIEVGFIPFDPFVSISELRDTALVLRDSGVWDMTGNLFSQMRVQKDTPYEYLLGRKGLLQTLDTNQLSYRWEFQDPGAAAVARACQSWSVIFDPVYRLLRNLERTKEEHSIAKEFMKAFRWLDLLALEDILLQTDNNLSDSRPLIIGKAFHNQRYSLARALESRLRPLAKEDEEDLLLDALNQFFSSFTLDFLESA